MITMFDNYVARHLPGNITEDGRQFWQIVVVKVTGALDEIDGRRWIEAEEIVETATIIATEAGATERGLLMAESFRRPA